MKWKRLSSRLLILAVFLILLAVVYLFPRIPIITGFAAKNMCSCLYIDNRTPESVKAVDLNFFPVNFATININEEQQNITASIFGLARTTAQFKDGYGCMLNNRYIKNPPENFQQATFLSSIHLSEENIDNVKVSYKILKTAVADAFEDDKEIENLNTRAIVVAHRGNIIYEEYALGFDKDSRLITWSVTKSFTNALIGNLVQQGKIDLNKPVDIKEWQNDERKNITWHNLLQMNSGLKWRESYDDLSDATKMLYKNADMFQYAVSKRAVAAPGERWNYSSGTSNILSGLIRQKLEQDAEYYAFPYKALFQKLGMKSAFIETDGAGNFVSSSYSFATARDLAKFGQLYLDNYLDRDTSGIIPQGWARYSATPAAGSNGNYGAHFWLNAGGKMPDVPRDVFYASGFKGQKIFIIPSHELVVVRLGQTMFDYDFNDFLSDIIVSVEPLVFSN